MDNLETLTASLNAIITRYGASDTIAALANIMRARAQAFRSLSPDHYCYEQTADDLDAVAAGLAHLGKPLTPREQQALALATAKLNYPKAVR